MKRLLVFGVLAVWTVTACSLIDARGSGDAGAMQPRPLSGLADGQHIGAIVGFESYDASLQQEVDDAWQQALDAGMRIGRVQLEWNELEIQPGIYDEQRLVDELERIVSDGLTPFVSFYAIDSGGPVLPADLSDPDSPTLIAGGASIDDPGVVERYRELLAWVIPIVVQYDAWVVSISNEPEGYLDDHPDQAPHFLSFVEQAVAEIHKLDASLPVTVTLTSTVIDQKPGYFDELMTSLDVAVYNYYPLRIDEELQFALREPLTETVPQHVDTLVAAAQGRPVVFQELGAPASDKATNQIGSSPELQATFFDIFFDEMAETPEIRAAYVFQLVDWSEELSQLITDPLRDEGFEPLANTMDEWLTTVGLLEYPSGDRRPAFDHFIEAIEGTVN